MGALTCRGSNPQSLSEEKKLANQNKNSQIETYVTMCTAAAVASYTLYVECSNFT